MFFSLAAGESGYCKALFSRRNRLPHFGRRARLMAESIGENGKKYFLRVPKKNSSLGKQIDKKTQGFARKDA